MRYGGDMVQYHCKTLLTLCNVPRDKRLRTAPVVIPGMSMASRAACRCALGGNVPRDKRLRTAPVVIPSTSAASGTECRSMPPGPKTCVSPSLAR
jgi:hypothetical protein